MEMVNFLHCGNSTSGQRQQPQWGMEKVINGNFEVYYANKTLGCREKCLG
jgi:hypothetical protein